MDPNEETDMMEVRQDRADRKSKPKRDRITLAHMKAQMSAFWRDGDTYIEICDKINDEFGLDGERIIGVNAIKYHIAAMIKRWKDLGMLNIDDKMAVVLAKYDQYEAIATEALFRSFDGLETQSYEKQIDRARSKEREAWLKEQIAQYREEQKASIKAADKRREDLPGFHQYELEGPKQLEVFAERVKKLSRTQNTNGDPRWLVILIDINDKRAKLWGLHQKAAMDQSPDSELARLTDEARDQRMAAILVAAMSRKTGDKGALAPPSPMGGLTDAQVASGPKLAPYRPLQIDEEILITPEIIKDDTEEDWNEGPGTVTAEEERDDDWGPTETPGKVHSIQHSATGRNGLGEIPDFMQFW